MVSKIVAAVIWEADAPCAVNTGWWQPASSLTESPRSKTRRFRISVNVLPTPNVSGGKVSP